VTSRREQSAQGGNQEKGKMLGIGEDWGAVQARRNIAAVVGENVGDPPAQKHGNEITQE
jgi:hypothetical protein